MQGCSLRCKYCQNRDTWDLHGGTVYTVDELVKKILRFVCPIDGMKFHERIWNIARKISPGDYFWSFYGECKPFEIVPASYIGKPRLYQFENVQLPGVEDSDRYLTHLFGNYMQLPPVEKRPVHADNAYLR